MGGQRGPAACVGAVGGEERQRPALDAERHARTRRRGAVGKADVERLAEEALVQVERGGRDGLVANGEVQLLLEPLEPLQQRTSPRGRTEEGVRRLLEPPFE